VEGWYDDPFGRHEYRYFDGAAWTHHVADLGVVGSDPAIAVLPPVPLSSPPGPEVNRIARPGPPVPGIGPRRAVRPAEAEEWIQREFHDAVVDEFTTTTSALNLRLTSSSGGDYRDAIQSVVRYDALRLVTALVLDDDEISEFELPLFHGLLGYFLQEPPDALDDEAIRTLIDGVERGFPPAPTETLRLCRQVDDNVARAAGAAGGDGPRLAQGYLQALERLGRYAITQTALAGSETEDAFHRFLCDQADSVGLELHGSVVDDEDAPDDGESLEDLLKELDARIGLTEVKAEVRTLINMAQIDQQRRIAGLPVAPVSNHLVFTGNPGTGKTTIARLLSRIYAALGVLERGHLVETSRADLVAGFVGQTSIKTEQVFRSAIGGTLFIDEAYSLVSGSDQDYGNEAVATLVKLMEDHRDEVVVVVAGYTDLMGEFIRSNPGLESRFKQTIEFPDYSNDELVAIFLKNCTDNAMELSPDALHRLRGVIADLPRARDFGNGRTVRKLFEHALALQANRLAPLPGPLTAEQLSLLLPEDINAPLR
jgi:Holliday junction resolvasome RuvABC ATP-dependent DNA helicase subunit